jgi:hypothetical protein
MSLTVGTDLMPFRSAGVLLATCLALAGCSKGADQPAGKAAGAQVLPGTISDAMLNLDQSRARPLLQPEPRTVASASDAASDEPSDTATDSDSDAAKPN